MFEPIDQKRVSDQALRQILGLIESGRLRPGDQLPGERDLTRQLGISRTAVREAIRLLEAQGVLKVRPGLGTFVAEWAHIAGLLGQWSEWLAEHQTQVLELLEVRGALEPLAAQLAAARAKQEDILALRDILVQIDRHIDAGNIEGAVAGDVAFHQLISHCGGNVFLIELNKGINVSLMENRYAYYSIAGRARLSNAQHHQIVDAIEARDPGGAAEAMRQHLQTSRSFVASLEINITE